METTFPVEKFLLMPLTSAFLWFQEISEAEAILSKNDLKLALKRIEDLQTAINGELDSDSGSDRFKHIKT